MKQIIGNQEHRTSKVDTEKWKEHAEYYNNPEKVKVKTEEETKVQTPTGIQDLENILQYDSKGRPKLRLTPVSNQWIAISSRTEHDILMQVYEAGGWRGFNFHHPTPTTIAVSEKEIRDSYISTTENIYWLYRPGIENTSKLVTPEEFYNSQNITPETLKELNEWYDQNAPNRASKGK